MKNYFDDLRKKTETKKAEAANLQAEIDKLESKKAALQEEQRAALAAKDQKTYVSIYQQIRDAGNGIEALAAYKKDVEGGGITKAEVIEAWSKTLESFEKDRKAKVAEYNKMKKKLAETYKELATEERNMNSLLNYARDLGKIESYSGELREVPKVEQSIKTTFDYLRKEMESLGYTIEDTFPVIY